MDKIYTLTISFLNGQVDVEKYKKELLKFSEIVDGNRSGNTSLSFISSAIDEITSLGTFEEDNNLRVQALITDIFNNFAHSLMSSKTKNVYTDELRQKAFGLKKLAVFEIIRECRRTNNKSYGIIEDSSQKDNMFVVDIPGCGQVKWHFPKNIIIYSQAYPFKVVDNRGNVTNKNLILQEKTTSEIRELSKHTQKVIMALDIEEMNQELGFNPSIISNLSSQTKEPTLEELVQLGNKGDNTQNIDEVVPTNE